LQSPIQTETTSIKILKIKLASSLVAICSLAAPALAGDQEDIQGTWKIEAMSISGKPMPVGAVVYIFAGQSLTLRAADGKEQILAFSLDSTSRPKFLVNQVAPSPSGAKPERTPYELTGDTLKLMPISPGEQITEVSDNGHVLITLKRSKSP